jgi:hypothetical protein
VFFGDETAKKIEAACRAAFLSINPDDNYKFLIDERIVYPFDGQTARKIAENPPQKKSFSEKKQCTTCQKRRYVCSNGKTTDGKVTSFKPGEELPRIWAHEREHARQARKEAQEKGKEIISIKTGIRFSTCPECGRRYVSGGKTVVLYKDPKKESTTASKNGLLKNFFFSKDPSFKRPKSLSFEQRLGIGINIDYLG